MQLDPEDNGNLYQAIEPKIADGAFVSPSATVVGNVEVSNPDREVYSANFYSRFGRARQYGTMFIFEGEQ